MKTALLFIALLSSTFIFGQDVIVLNENNLSRSIADQFTIYESDEDITIEQFLKHKEELVKKKLTSSVANLDFTTGTYFIHFSLSTRNLKGTTFYLETARPITNVVELQMLNVSNSPVHYSGDAIPFEEKIIDSKNSVLPIFAEEGHGMEYVLKLQSDGEIISLPMTFSTPKQFHSAERSRQFNAGIFYGIFLFVIIIYLTFYLLLKDSLYLFYTIYVIFSGLLQFALDGYLHKYIFTSGGYWTQHGVLLIAGLTVFFAFMYATEYLSLSGRQRKISMGLSIIVLTTTFASLIPGGIYELSYPIINGFALLTLVFLIVLGIKVRKTNQSISILFLIGLFSLLIGGVIFILGNFSIIDIPDLTQNSLKTGTLVEILCLSVLMAGKYKSLQDEKEAAQKELVVQLGETNIRLELEVEERTKQIESQRLELKERNDDFVASIKYAERIQNAILPHELKFKNLLPDSFVLFKPKDIVSGDFYWIEDVHTTKHESDKLIVYATADCTGHGVPGAFVSIVCSNLLKLGKTHKDVNSPGEALDFINQEINETLNSEFSEEEIRDGMDVALCAIDFDKKILYFAGAKNGIYIIRDKEILEYKGDRKAIGNTISKDHEFYTTHEIKIEKGDIIYSFTDGIVDQFGGEKGKKFMSKRVKELLLTVAELPMEEQKMKIEQAFMKWKGDLEQIDDVLVIGVRV